jgi:hypothetical protein
LNETSPGLVVAVYDSALTKQKHECYLAYVSLTKKRVLKKVAAPGKVKSLANIIDGEQYPSQVQGLNSSFQRKWPHIIGVSIYKSGAALTHLAMTSEDEEHGEHCHKATNVIILGKTFITDEDSFTFRDDQGQQYSGNRSNFYQHLLILKDVQLLLWVFDLVVFIWLVSERNVHMLFSWLKESFEIAPFKMLMMTQEDLFIFGLLYQEVTKPMLFLLLLYFLKKMKEINAMIILNLSLVLTLLSLILCLFYHLKQYMLIVHV